MFLNSETNNNLTTLKKHYSAWNACNALLLGSCSFCMPFVTILLSHPSYHPESSSVFTERFFPPVPVLVSARGADGSMLFQVVISPSRVTFAQTLPPTFAIIPTIQSSPQGRKAFLRQQVCHHLLAMLFQVRKVKSFYMNKHISRNIIVGGPSVA